MVGSRNKHGRVVTATRSKGETDNGGMEELAVGENDEEQGKD